MFELLLNLEGFQLKKDGAKTFLYGLGYDGIDQRGKPRKIFESGNDLDR